MTDYRLTSIYTRIGDDGTTRLGNNVKVSKDHPRVVAYGGLDEVNSALGVALSEEMPAPIRELLRRIQNELFDLGAELCLPGHEGVTEEKVTKLEQDLDALNASLPPLKEFVLPGGCRAAAQCHLARAICRRVERDIVSLSKDERISPTVLKYINRLSDLLFVVARALNQSSGTSEPLWQK